MTPNDDFEVENCDEFELRLLQNRYKRLAIKIEALEEQIGITRDADEILGLEQKREKSLKDLRAVAQEQKKLKAKINQGTQKQRLQNYVDWQANFSQIDYDKAKSDIEKVLNKLNKSGGHALFFMQNTAVMGGEWCIQALRESIDSMRGMKNPPEIFSFSALDTVQAHAILNYLYQLNPNDKDSKRLEPTNQEISIDDVIRSIEGRLTPGSIYYLQIDIKCLIEADCEFLIWFVEKFWLRLTGQISSQRRNRLIAVLAVDGAVSKEILPEGLKKRTGKIESRRTLELKLDLWKKKDIEDWLIDCSGLCQPPHNLKMEQMSQMASIIHANSRGQPRTAHAQIMNTITELAG